MIRKVVRKRENKKRVQEIRQNQKIEKGYKKKRL